MVLGVGVPYAFFNGGWGLGLFLIPWGAIFGGVGVYVLYGARNGLVFDSAKGSYYRGKVYDASLTADRDKLGMLSDIYALQIISEHVRSSSSSGGSSSYNSYEINLVFGDGERLNVMDHGKLAAIEKDAKTLAQFLSVPIWQASL